MKNKTFNFRCSDEFNQFVESAWHLSKYKEKGIRSKGDLIRYMIFRGIEEDYRGILKKFEDVPEINDYLNFKAPKSSTKLITNRFAEEYFIKRKTGDIKFENETDPYELKKINQHFDKKTNK
jgi:hypothetical protein